MASVHKRGSNYSVIYWYKDDNGCRKQKWESGYSYRDALKRKTEIEYQKKFGHNLCAPTMTFSEFAEHWLPIHAAKNWQFNTYSSASAYLQTHILPTIGNYFIRDITPYMIEHLISQLYNKQIVTSNEAEPRYLSSTTIRHVYQLLNIMFSKAAEWRYIDESPVICSTPKRSNVKQDIWTPDMFIHVLNIIENQLLHLAVHLSFVCSLRIGEVLAINISDIDFYDKSISINKTIQRVSNKAIAAITSNNIIKCFPVKSNNSGSSVIFKSPKTKSSTRKVFMSKALADEMHLVIKKSKEASDYYGWTYNDLLFCLPEDGSPVTPDLCSKWFRKWQSANKTGFPYLSFHGIRHSSSTYKLLLSHGDYKAVQGDTGHARAESLMDIYAHFQDENRRKLLEHLENDFYK